MDATYYIGTADYKIYKLESTVQNIPYSGNSSKGALSSVATFVDRPSFKVPVLSHLETQLNLPFKKGKDTYNVKIKAKIAVYEDDPELIHQYFSKTNEFVVDRSVVTRTTYDPSFWADNPIVKRTPLEDGFIMLMENKKAFGTMVGNQ